MINQVNNKKHSYCTMYMLLFFSMEYIRQKTCENYIFKLTECSTTKCKYKVLVLFEFEIFDLIFANLL